MKKQRQTLTDEQHVLTPYNILEVQVHSYLFAKMIQFGRRRCNIFNLNARGNSAYFLPSVIPDEWWHTFELQILWNFRCLRMSKCTSMWLLLKMIVKIDCSRIYIIHTWTRKKSQQGFASLHFCKYRWERITAVRMVSTLTFVQVWVVVFTWRGDHSRTCKVSSLRCGAIWIAIIWQWNEGDHPCFLIAICKNVNPLTPYPIFLSMCVIYLNNFIYFLSIFFCLQFPVLMVRCNVETDQMTLLLWWDEMRWWDDEMIQLALIIDKDHFYELITVEKIMGIMNQLPECVDTSMH